MDLEKFTALRAKKCKKGSFFFFLHLISSKIKVVKEKAGKKRKNRKRKKEEKRIYLWLTRDYKGDREAIPHIHPIP